MKGKPANYLEGCTHTSVLIVRECFNLCTHRISPEGQLATGSVNASQLAGNMREFRGTLVLK